MKKNTIQTLFKDQKEGRSEGFTLLELLIVIGILAILGSIVIFVLNPAETLRKTRDSQRITDLSTIKTALGLYITSTSTPHLDDSTYSSRNDSCRNGIGTVKLYYSYPSDSPGGSITDITFDSVGGSARFTTADQQTNTNVNKVDGNGWLPVKLDALIGGAPISSFPTDPTNSINTLGTVTSTDRVYRYACDKNDLTFEVNASLESTAFTTGDDNKLVKDGGDNPNFVETGSKTSIISSGSDL